MASPRAETKSPVSSTGLFQFAWWISLRGFVRDSGIVAVSIGICLAVGLTVCFGLGLGAAARALGELAFDFLHGFGFRHVLDDGNLARQAIERGFVKLTFAVGLLGLRFGAIEIAHDLGDRDDVARIDLGFVFLGAARPHRTLDAGTALQGLQRL